MRQPYRLGLDLGANSIGWCAIDLTRDGQEVAVRRLGVRIFSDGRNPKDKSSLATARRTARSMRRRRDRYLRRRTALLDALIAQGLMPSDEAARKALVALPPYELRARGLHEALTLHEFGRALFHLNQRRGFKTNRKADRDAKEKGLIVEGIKALRAHIADSGSLTYGEFLAKRLAAGRSVRARLHGSGREAAYEFYPQRELLEEEFDRLWAKQAAFHGDALRDRARDRIRRIIFFQRPLKPVDPGKCTFEAGETRAPWALPIAQSFRLLQDLANLRLSEDDGLSRRHLTPDERDAILRFVRGEGKDRKIKKKVTFKQIRKLLGLNAGVTFSHEDEKRDGLPGDETGFLLADAKCFGPRWLQLTQGERTAIVTRLLDDEDETGLIAWLMDRWGLDEATAGRVADTPLPESHCRLSAVALGKLVPIVATEGVEDGGRVRPIRYDEAAARVYGHHSDRRTGEVYDRLPYYGEVLGRHVLDAPPTANDLDAARWGLIANPTVHIGLNQLRKLVNDLIARYGHPQEIVIELARDLKLSRDERSRIQKEQAANQQRNEDWRVRLRAEFNIDPRPGDLVKMRLWEELPAHRKECVYTGELITLARLFGADSPIEVDHIIPFSRSFDDTLSNKVLCIRRANRAKVNQTPFEAFGGAPTIEGQRYDWAQILARMADLPPAKRRRFDPDYQAAPDDFLARHLNDTRYLARIAREYLTAICHPDRVWVVPGRLTEMLRRKWALNPLLSDHNHKNRTDHRHHAIDAVVVGLTTRARLRQLQLMAEAEAGRGSGRRLGDMPEPWPSFREDLATRLGACIVSFKPDHGHQARMHNDTAYGLIEADADPAKPQPVVHRKPLGAFTSKGDLAAIRDARLRRVLEEAVEAGARDGLDVPASLRQFAEQASLEYPECRGLRRIRVVERLAVVPIEDRSGRAFKAYKGDSNACFRIVADPATGRWRGGVESTFDAYQRTAGRLSSDGSRPVMMLYKDDLVALDEPDGSSGRAPRVLRVVKFSGSTFILADHNEAGNLKARDADPDDPFRYVSVSAESFRKRGGRRVTVSPLGVLNDAGRQPALAAE